jgi:amino acid transporter
MPEAPPGLVRELGLRDLVMFNVAAVVGIRWLSTAAHIGPGSLTLWASAAFLFFVPLALAVSGLNDRYPVEGGIYAWTGRSFGEWHGFLCGWCYWLSNLFYFPGLLVAGIGISIFTLGRRYQALADDALLVTSASLAVLWLALGTNLVGFRVGKWTQNLGGIATCAACGVIVAGGMAVLAHHGSATRLDIRPQWNWTSLNYWPQIAFAFGGLELGAILSGEIRDPRRTVRRAAWISSLLVGGFYILGTLAILALLPPERVSIVTGLAQAGESMGARFGWMWISPALAALIAVGIMGQFGAWVGGSARLAFAIGVDRYLPASFGSLHPRWRTPHVALLVQGIACTAFLVIMQAGESLRAGYQLLVDMTVVTYFIPFLYLFGAAWKHGQRWSGLAGLLVTAIGIAFSFAPPAGVTSVLRFETKLLVSCVVLIVSARLFFVRVRRRAPQTDPVGKA